MSQTPSNAVKFTGAHKGDILEGLLAKASRGLLIQIHSDQPKNRDRGGPILGSFDLLCAGNGMYSTYLRKFEGQGFQQASALIQKVKNGGGEKCECILNSDSLAVRKETLIPEEISETEVFYEGASQQIKVNAYERNPKARAQCISYYESRGYRSTCLCCEGKFSEVYGELGERLIIVHHLKPISSIRERYEVDPIHDLIPVCPNCHAIIHKRHPPLTIDEVKKIIRQNKLKNPKMDSPG